MNSHELLKSYIDIVANENINSLIVKGVAGTGKTHTVLATLREMGMIENKHFVYITGYITPVKLYSVLSSCRMLENPKLFVFDDLDGIVGNKTCVALLKSCLWEARGKRVVSYQTSRSSGEEPAFEFDGKVILIVNSLNQENALGQPLLDRGIYYDMTLDSNELCHYIEETVLPRVEQRIPMEEKQLVWEKVKRFSDQKKFSIRCLHRAFDFYKYNKDNWYHLFESSMR